jgi:glycosyltransferase involved in cell wall biosynthesis
VVGLHDLPRPDEPRRRAAYAAVALRSDQVVVCSEHERRRLHDLGPADAVVIPHPVERRQPCRPSTSGERGEVAVLGFVYPGKGHDDVIVAASRSRSRPSVLVLGGPAPGHEPLVDELATAATRLGIGLRATGWVPEADLAAETARASVPVVPNCAPSASGSLATWLAAGRRPLVRDSDYAREVAELVPGGLELYPGDDPEALAARLDALASSPSSTLGPGVPDALRPERIARRWAEIAGEAS